MSLKKLSSNKLGTDRASLGYEAARSAGERFCKIKPPGGDTPVPEEEAPEPETWLRFSDALTQVVDTAAQRMFNPIPEPALPPPLVKLTTPRPKRQ